MILAIFGINNSAEWPELHQPATKAENFIYADACSSCFYATHTLGLANEWFY